MFFIKIWVSITMIICRFSRFMLRKLGRGGTNVPGTIALKLCPSILKYLSRDVTVLLVTGTNGKTTITRMVESVIKANGDSYFTNKSGANMDTGIVGEFVCNCTLGGKCRYKYALIECDELAFKLVSRYADIKYVIVSNVFRDQLDRYGEITHTITGIYEGIKNIPNAIVCLNADCSLSVSLKDRIPNNVVFYGMDVPIYTDLVKEVSDAPYCIKCGAEYEYRFVSYGHLGDFYCPKCGYKKPATSVSVCKVYKADVDYNSIRLKINGEEIDAIVNIPGGHNIYNSCATTAMCTAMGIDKEIIVKALGQVECGFGRMEKFNINGTNIRMILVKNPSGANQTLNFVNNITEPTLFMVGLNDNYADGTDVSWIWDADFEILAQMGDRLKEVVVTGKRCDDMALRFKYAGVPTEKIKIIKDYSELIKYAVDSGTDTFIMPTYTAMLDIREVFSKEYNYKEFWK